MTTETPEGPERGRRSGGVLGRLSGHVQAWHVGLVAGIVVAVAVGGYLWLSDGAPTNETADAPQPVAQQGVACPHLQQAFTHSQAGDRTALRRSVDDAARASEQALQQSGQEFGRPEEIAIELQHALAQARAKAAGDAQALLAEARAACEEVDQWEAGE